ncbi:Nucleoporin nup82 [Leucoagaricus sp. SymC.cos]|nr:Nucleoporin nup82 [Leucoagaricus sp. SymC.cos]
MKSDNEWNEILKNHPIFSLPKSFQGPTAAAETLLELSTNSLPRFVEVDPLDDGPTPSGRRQTMVLKDADLIVAAGKEIRMASLGGTKSGQSTRKSYKALHTPSLQFEIHQIALNPSGKLLAVVGAFQVAVIVLPRPGYMRLVPESIDCKSVQIGQFYHASENSVPIAKIEWHPWGEAASTLLVMTADGKLREYDISVDTEEPQQVLSFVPERKSKSYLAEDASEREVVSFALGKGRADWGPLTVYALMRSGDIYAVCPYLPKNASVPSSYIHSLECFISAKQEFLAQGNSNMTQNLATIYDYQQKYVSALLRQLPPGTAFPATSRAVSMHPPTSIKTLPVRQGPFLLQPAPRLLEGSEGGDATDIAYLVFGADDEDSEREGNPTDHLGIITVAYQDGKVDLFLDVEKVEARWNVKGLLSHDLPMLAVYETIDLGLLSAVTLNSCSSLLQANHPVFFLDPIHDDTFYVYHAFGIHALQIGPVLQHLAVALRGEDDDALLDNALQTPAETLVRPLLTTFSVERKSSNPIVGVTSPNDVYLSYSILVLSSSMRISVFPLTLRSDALHEANTKKTITPTRPEETLLEKSTWLTPAEGAPPPFASLLVPEPYHVPSILTSSGLPSMPKHVLPVSTASKEIVLTPDVMRYLTTASQHISSQIRDIFLAFRAAQLRAQLQQEELRCLIDASRAMNEKVETLKCKRKEETESRVQRIQETQKELLARLDRLLSALMKKASPELSEHETKWFEELKRMKEEMLGAGKYDDGSLTARTRQLDKEFARIMPNLKALVEEEKKRKDRAAEINGSLGFSQAFGFGQRSNIERTKIDNLEKEVVKLAEQLDVTLEKPSRLD